MFEIRALLFDLDGTLVDTADANYRAYAAALAEVGCAVERAAFDMIATGRRWSQFLPVLLPAASPADHAKVAARKQKLYPAFIGASQVNAPLLAFARAAQFRRALVTNASRPSTDIVLAAHDLTALFDVIVTGDDVANPKPAPDAYLFAMDKLGLGPAECIAFEDSDLGVDSAQRAGVYVVRVTL